MRTALFVLLLGAAVRVWGQDAAPDAGHVWAPVVGIEFSGNRVTRPQVMRRELTLAEGDPADPVQIEASRQAIQNLGLFRSVSAETVPVGAGRIVIFSVQEKIYLLPLPRLDAKDSGEYAYGAQVRWANVGGLHHNLGVYGEYRDRKEAGFGVETSYGLDYTAPQIFETRNTLSLGAGYSRRPVERGETDRPDYEEAFRSARIQVSRSLSAGSPNQGWRAGTGVSWLEQSTHGIGAEPAYGTATSLLFSGGYRDVNFRRYSAAGQVLGASLSVATEDWASDYDQIVYRASWRRFQPVGRRAHQSLNAGVELAARHGGPPENDAFELGGTANLRGFDEDFLEGDAYYRLFLEFLRPLHWNALRGLVILETGNVFAQPRDATLSRSYTSLGLGLRLRVDGFVGVELDLGYAFPVGGGGDGGRVFIGQP